MANLSNMLRDILCNTSDCCCLCYSTIGELESPFKIVDEVSLSHENKTTKVLYEIINIVLGVKVLNSISEENIICLKCTEMILNCYKFIKKCTHNIEQLQSTLVALQNHAENISTGNHDYKSLFVALDTSNCNVQLYYDKHRNSNNQTLLRKRFQRIYKDAQEYYIDIEVESVHSGNNKTCAGKRRKKSSNLQNNVLADIVHDMDDINHLKCKVCLKSYPSVMKIRQHYQRVHAPKDFKCTQCPRTFGSLLLLKQHKKASHCDAVCSQCGKTYTNLYSLRHHERGHSKLRLICQTCGKVYKGKQAFKNHIDKKLCQQMRKSNAEAKLSCDYCGKKYAQKTALSVHKRLEHENGKALICDWCGKKLSSMSRLKDHIIKHTKQKNFECEQCGGKFVTKTSLLYHTRTHTGEKPYECEYCAMTFLSASRRSEHVKRHHTQSNLECDICHSKFKGNTCLNRHRKKHFDVRSRLYCNPASTV